jgi:hypothetical protein
MGPVGKDDVSFRFSALRPIAYPTEGKEPQNA